MDNSGVPRASRKLHHIRRLGGDRVTIRTRVVVVGGAHQGSTGALIGVHGPGWNVRMDHLTSVKMIHVDSSDLRVDYPRELERLRTELHEWIALTHKWQEKYDVLYEERKSSDALAVPLYGSKKLNDSSPRRTPSTRCSRGRP